MARRRLRGVRPRAANSAPGLSTTICSGEALTPAIPNDWFLRRASSAGCGGRRWRRRWACPRRSRHSPLIRPRNRCRPASSFRSSGRNSPPMGWCSLWRANWGSSILGTLDDRGGDTYEPEVAPLRPARRDVCGRSADQEAGGLPTKKRAGAAPCPLFSPSVWGRFFGQTIHNHYQRLRRSPRQRQSGRLPGRDRSSARIADRRSVRARRPLWRLWRRERRRERPGHQSGGDGLYPHPHRIDEPQLLVRGRLLDACRARRLVSRRRAARDLVLRLGQHPVRHA